MNTNGLVRKAGGTVATGLVGVYAAEAVKRLLRSGAIRQSTVSATAWGLRGVRAAESGAEATRLVAADIAAEARSKLGERAPAPGANPAPHDHDH